jgi:hypothetical protein
VVSIFILRLPLDLEICHHSNQGSKARRAEKYLFRLGRRGKRTYPSPTGWNELCMTIGQFKNELELITQVILPNNFEILTLERMMGSGNLNTLYVSVIQPLILSIRVSGVP